MAAANLNSSEPTSCSLRSRLNNLFSTRTGPKTYKTSLPPPSEKRLQASRHEAPFDLNFDAKHVSGGEKTVLYLAYGSNLCHETFQGKRGIRPLSQINVVVPSLRLTFDLPGIPYLEPCFSNSGLRNRGQRNDNAPSRKEPLLVTTDYHKDRWKKGLVGVVYEVTMADYTHIIATEGGGTGYKDVLVDCYPLHDEHVVPEEPTSQPFRAHTLFAPAQGTSFPRRPDPSYAQPSARYLKLITNGAEEHSLPQDYKDYLYSIRPFTITTRRQRLGQIIFSSIWMPLFLLIITLQEVFQDENGKSPGWLAAFANAIMKGAWISYDGLFKKLFGDGERTIEEEEDDDDEEKQRLFK
ncbi:Butirosin biosynthesis BtrG-like protein [Macrophomina phaseolina MS6]|uniref:gamma-glutamylcyclotransferase n=1 Tax=Macrophomina phaseolina (strain MS6) TaxID=1126212 RepID=K2RJI9_MACPH|nr:Butirosin biosynthesis BtrG-like protein [Macrophomina phaseolina MS6]